MLQKYNSNKLRFVLLIICAGVLIISNLKRDLSLKERTSVNFKNSGSKNEGSDHKEEGSRRKEGSKNGNDEHSHNTIDHSDPENQRRMGIFHYNEGNKMLAQGKVERAITDYKKALHHHPKLASAQVNMSSAYLKLKRFDEAYNTLKTLESLEPKNPHLHYNYACLYSLTSKRKESLNFLKKSVNFGLPVPGTILTDPDLEYLRESQAFKIWFKTLNAK